MGLAAAVAASPSKASAANHQSVGGSVFDIRSYGAAGDGKTVDSPAINRAIEAAAAAGGGTVFFPAGTWLCFSIRLKSYVELYLAQGATIVAADSPLPGASTGYNGGIYDAAEPNAAWEAYQDYGHNHWHNSLLWGESLHDVSITGPGLIHGKGLSFGGTREARGNYPVYVAEQAGVGNKAIALKNCRNVIFRDFSILKGGHFGLLLTGVDNLTIDNLKIDTDRDGMDLDCCKNARVSNCTVNSPWDDGICPKSSYALGYSRTTEDVTITNCYVTGTYELGTVLDGSFKKFGPGVRVPRTGRIKCGTESNGGFKNITISNCVFEGCDGLALESEDGALCEDITISNITMRDIVTSPLFLRLGARLRGPKESTQVGKMQRILINNVVSSNANSRLCSILSGVPDHAIQDIKLSNIYQEHTGGASRDAVAIRPPEYEERYPDPGMFGPMPAQGFYLRHIRNLEMSHVEIRPIEPDPRPSFFLESVNRADFIAVTAPTDHPAFYLEKVTDLRILLSRAAKDIQMESADKKNL
ncbi:glycoside hydrolase family 28 protein [Tunturiibacter empetritectus]|uniref:Polygalacturonase n=1 Tax=Tunturiibacter lichenicola TaxID=2051959 RepID=A0A852VEA5_9BACT|nr:glycoside hydrolase family 28 protein [Edaphobacter lichenicola]NYF91193.1 polygalacturonase [Edaphobacter lichenicola]